MYLLGTACCQHICTSKLNSTLGTHLHPIIRYHDFDFEIGFWPISALMMKTLHQSWIRRSVLTVIRIHKVQEVLVSCKSLTARFSHVIKDELLLRTKVMAPKRRLEAHSQIFSRGLKLEGVKKWKRKKKKIERNSILREKLICPSFSSFNFVCFPFQQKGMRKHQGWVRFYEWHLRWVISLNFC